MAANIVHRRYAMPRSLLGQPASPGVVLSLLALLIPVSTGSAQADRRVANSGRDLALPMVLRERIRLGADANGVTFYRVYPWNVATDGGSNLYVLDGGDFRVSMFDSNGVHVRDVGRQGGGPGEFRRPVGVAVTRSGVISVADEIKRALVRFDASGDVLEQRPLFFRAGILRATNRGILMGTGSSPGRVTGLHQVWPDTITLATTAASEPVSFSGCPVAVSGLQPFFAPAVVWGTWGATTVINDTVGYELRVLTDGVAIATITRDIRPITIDRRTALRDPGVQRGFVIYLEGQKQCEMSPQQVLDGRGFHTTRSPVEGIVVLPNGGFWVQRRLDHLGPVSIDVFAAGGQYQGTLDQSIPFPSTFLSHSRFATVESDADGAPYIVIYEIR